MKALRRLLDRIEPAFAARRRFARFGALYEMVDTLLYSPADVTTRQRPRARRHRPEARDDHRRARRRAAAAGRHLEHRLPGQHGDGRLPADRATRLARRRLIGLVGLGLRPGAACSTCLVHGLRLFPADLRRDHGRRRRSGRFCSPRAQSRGQRRLLRHLAAVRADPAGHDRRCGRWRSASPSASSSARRCSAAPARTSSTRRWPAVRFCTLPTRSQMSGDAVWTAVDGYSGATALALRRGEWHGRPSSTLASPGPRPSSARSQGSIGETSTLACLLGVA